MENKKITSDLRENLASSYLDTQVDGCKLSSLNISYSGGSDRDFAGYIDTDYCT